MTRLLLVLSFWMFATTALAAQQQVCDDDWSIKPKAVQVQFVQLDRALPVLINLRGVKHAAKGFLVRIVPAQVWEDFVAKKVTAAALHDYDSEKATSYNRTKTFKAGRWAVVVDNSENLLERAIIHARIVIDPDPS